MKKNNFLTKFQFLFIAILLFSLNTTAQVGIGTTNPASGALLDLDDANRGLLVPRVTISNLATAAPVTAPTTGLLVWNLDAGTGVGFHYWNGTAWVPIGGGAISNDWTILGNNITAAGGGTITTDGTNFIGTTNNRNLNFRTNNIYRGRLSNLGEFFIGTQNTVIPGDLMNAVSNATFPWAVNGYSSFNGGGTYGSVQAGSTVFGGVQGEYFGTSATGTGVRGINGGASLGSAVNGQYTGLNAGVRVAVLGQSIAGAGNSQIGIWGEYDGITGWGIGVVGLGAGGGIPVGNFDIGVLGWRTNNANYSGYFNGNHVIANGTKTASVGTSKGNQLLYVTESPEVWFEDMGKGRLVNGEVTIKLDPILLETVFIDDEHPMIVFLQEEGDSNGLYVITGKDSFTVKEKGNGTSNIQFSYKISAKRRHFQDHRFGNDPLWGPGDTRKYNSYATPPPVDYEENVRFQEEQKRNYVPTPMPEGFIDYFKLHEKMKINTERPKVKSPSNDDNNSTDND